MTKKRMNIEKQNHRNSWNGKSVNVEMMNFRLNLEFEWKELGVGIDLFKPIYRKFPRKSFWLGVAIRFLWFGLFLKIIEKKPDKQHLEYYEKMELENEFAAFYYKQLIVFKNNNTLNVSWNWHEFGLMLFCQRRGGESNGHFSLLVLWASIGII